MSAKKPTAKQPQKEVQLDLESSEKITALEDKIAALEGKIATLNECIGDKNERIKQLSNVIDVQSKDLDELSRATLVEGVALESPSLRTTMLMAMLPQVRIDYPRPDAQKAAESVDVIMEVWGFSDDD